MKTKNLFKILIPTVSTLAIAGTTLTACETGGGTVHKAPKILGYSTVIKTVRYKYQLMIDNVVVKATWSIKNVSQTDAKFIDAENGILEIGSIDNDITIVGKAANGTTVEKTLKVSNYNNGIIMTGDHFLPKATDDKPHNYNYKACVAYPGVTPETQDPDIEWTWTPGWWWEVEGAEAPTFKVEEDGSVTLTVVQTTDIGYGTLTAKSKSNPSNYDSWTVSVGIDHNYLDQEAIETLFPEGYVVDLANNTLRLNHFINEEELWADPELAIEILAVYDLDWLAIPDEISWNGAGGVQKLKVILGDNVFSHNTLISCIYLSDGVQIPDSLYYAFQHSSLHTIRLPDDMKTIPFHCFDGCKNLKYIKLPNSVQTIDRYSFQNSSIQYIDIDKENSQLSQIGINAFDGCIWLSSFTMPKAIKTIDDRAFRGCASLLQCNMPESGTIEVGEEVFYGCRNLRSLDLSLCHDTSMGDDFDEIVSRCFSLGELRLPATFAPYIDDTFAAGCIRLQTLYYPGTHTKWLSLWGECSVEEKFSSLPLNAVVMCWESEQWVSYPLFN